MLCSFSKHGGGRTLAISQHKKQAQLVASNAIGSSKIKIDHSPGLESCASCMSMMMGPDEMKARQWFLFLGLGDVC